MEFRRARFHPRRAGRRCSGARSRRQQFQRRRSGRHGDIHSGGPAIPVTDIDVTITDVDSTTIQSATITILGWSLHPGDLLSIAGSLPGGITASSYNEITGVLTLSGSASLADYQTALRQVVYSNTLAAPSTADRGIQVTVNDGSSRQQYRDDVHACRDPATERCAGARPRREQLDDARRKLSHRIYRGRPAVAIADADVSIVDSDNPNLASATITLTNPQTRRRSDL